MSTSESPAKHFIEQHIETDLAKNKVNQIVTRFPPEPNGYLHIGHAKSICLNFEMAKQYNGRCHLRFDDTNPTKEDVEYINAIKADISWLEFEWDSLHHASNYFEQFYDYAVTLINKNLAYVDSLSNEELKAHRGTLTEPGKNSPYRDRSIEENLDLFKRMRAGEFADGTHVLRAKIDMASSNLNLRDPVIYRILHVAHPHAGNDWCIYPMYDYAHCLSDAIEGITHSLCTLEFQDHRPLYDWFLAQLTPTPHPQQLEFSRLNLSHTITSKRKLKYLVESGHVSGWDDPRLSTLAAVRRRGFTPKAIRQFCKRLGISKNDSIIDMSLLEECVRDDLNHSAPRAFCVLNPIKVVIDNWDENHTEALTAPNHPQQPELGNRTLNMGKIIFIDAEDFKEIPPRKYKRLVEGGEVRLRYGYVIKCNQVIKNEAGDIIELRCTYDPETLGKNPEGRKVKGVIHWLSETDAVPAQVNVYDRLFNQPNPGACDSLEALAECINPNSLITINHALVEANLNTATPESRYQFEREGYFVLDQHHKPTDNLVFNRIVALRDSWEKITP